MSYIQNGSGGSGSFDPHSPGPIGDVTPSTGAFTALSVVSSNIDLTIPFGSNLFLQNGSGSDIVGLFILTTSTVLGGTASINLSTDGTTQKVLWQLKNIASGGDFLLTATLVGDFFTGTSAGSPGNVRIQTAGIDAIVIDANQNVSTTAPVTISPGYTVATLPAGVIGMRAYVTDANATTFNSNVAGTGANVVPVFYNGTNWVIG